MGNNFYFQSFYSTIPIDEFLNAIIGMYSKLVDAQNTPYLSSSNQSNLTSASIGVTVPLLPGEKLDYPRPHLKSLKYGRPSQTISPHQQQIKVNYNSTCAEVSQASLASLTWSSISSINRTNYLIRWSDVPAFTFRCKSQRSGEKPNYLLRFNCTHF